MVVYWYWWILAAVFTLLELLLPGVFFLWMAIPAFLLGALLMVAPGLGLEWQLFIFAILAGLSVYVGQRLMRRYGAEDSDQPLLNQRMAQYIGRTYVVSEAIVNGHGRVRIGDTSWRVEGPDVTEGSRVKIVGAVGTTLQVAPADKVGLSQP